MLTISDLLSDARLSDVTLRVYDADGNTTGHPAHRSILATKSEFFEPAFVGGLMVATPFASPLYTANE
ncbi:hypothetical protein BU16DRAFT_554019 [Lophium mytilinum]|uniref:BTB domain-containing protein n=1 Tax=Lophium mytilinum TaxID=390894 RepID=A0A6A6RDZ6_9PEZI|nr:hypothetical protein BU16DRAFT_554019 [Lophium mytilinum]